MGATAPEDSHRVGMKLMGGREKNGRTEKEEGRDLDAFEVKQGVDPWSVLPRSVTSRKLLGHVATDRASASFSRQWTRCIRHRSNSTLIRPVTLVGSRLVMSRRLLDHVTHAPRQAPPPTSSPPLRRLLSRLSTRPA
eukprot:3932247-Rhodomonas_salina.1